MISDMSFKTSWMLDHVETKSNINVQDLSRHQHSFESITILWGIRFPRNPSWEKTRKIPWFLSGFSKPSFFFVQEVTRFRPHPPKSLIRHQKWPKDLPRSHVFSKKSPKRPCLHWCLDAEPAECGKLWSIKVTISSTWRVWRLCSYQQKPWSISILVGGLNPSEKY